MLLSYLRLVLFAVGLLVGVQVPGFIDDYGSRVAAHRLESEQGLKGFRNLVGKHSGNGYRQDDIDELRFVHG